MPCYGDASSGSPGDEELRADGIDSDLPDEPDRVRGGGSTARTAPTSIRHAGSSSPIPPSPGCQALVDPGPDDPLAGEPDPASRVRQEAGKNPPVVLVLRSPRSGSTLLRVAGHPALFCRPELSLLRHESMGERTMSTDTPHAAIDSLAKNRFDQLVDDDEGEPWTVAESYWTRCNRSRLELDRRVAASRVQRVRFESLVREPGRTMTELCRFLSAPFDEAVLRPREGERMRSGPGDPGLPDREGVDPDRAEGRRDVELPRPLGAEARRVVRIPGCGVAPA